VLSRDVLAFVGLLIVASLASGPGGRDARAEERPKTSSAVQVPAQGGGGVEPVPGAPPPVAPSLESRPVPATLGPVPSRARATASRSSLRALSTAEGEATVEIDGVREAVRPGSRLGRDTVKSVSPGRLVLDRPAAGKEPGALVIVTFDEAGRAKEQAFWTADPTVPAAPEVKQP
jgi:hypothetical protein